MILSLNSRLQTGTRKLGSGLFCSAASHADQTTLAPGRFIRYIPRKMGASPDPMLLKTTPNENAVSLMDYLKGGGQATTPRFVSPALSGEAASIDRSTLPLMLYLPGIDGTGLAASRQFARLQQGYDLRAMIVPPGDRSDFATLAAVTRQYLLREIRESGGDPLRPVYLLGESFGGLLAIQVALDLGPDVVHRVVLVNPASSFERAPWRTLGPLLTSLPPELYNNLPYALSPILTNPLGLMAYTLSSVPFPSGRLPGPADVAKGLSQLGTGLLQLLPSLGALSDILPPQTLKHRLDLLGQGCVAVVPRLGDVQQRTLALFSEMDLLIPSADEARRYRRAYPRARVRVMGGRGHALLQEGGVDLLDLIGEAGFYVERRNMSSSGELRAPVAKRGRAARGDKRRDAVPDTAPVPLAAAARDELAGAAEAQAEDAAQALAATATATAAPPAADPRTASHDTAGPSNGSGSGAAPGGNGRTQSTVSRVSLPPASDGDHDASGSSGGVGGAASAFLSARPIELPTRRELELQREDNSINLFARATSPVFISTDAEGKRHRGLAHVDLGSSKRPVLLIGNHQLWSPDLGLFITQILEEKGVMVRGLAHPAIFAQSQAARAGQSPGPISGPVGAADLVGGRDGTGPGGGAGGIGQLFQQFGAVQVSSRNFYRLLQLGEVILLFPGGVREAYKRRGETYELFWPERAEFVRLAARFGATIIPFSAVGAEDGVTIVADSEQLKNLPILGDRLRQGTANMPRARKGVAAESFKAEFGESGEDFIAPLIVPNGLPERYYFLFGKPIELTGAETKEETQEIYQQCKQEVAGGIAWLREERQKDSFRDGAKRIPYEAAWGFSRQAPTFSLD